MGLTAEIRKGEDGREKRARVKEPKKMATCSYKAISIW